MLRAHGKISLLFSLLVSLTACSFQAQHPAPVVNISSHYQPTYVKGSIKTQYYRVKRGDTLYSIAWGANRDVTYIAKNNLLTKPYTIYPGQILKLTISVKNQSGRTSISSVVTTPAKPVKSYVSKKNQVVTYKREVKKQTVAVVKKSLDQPSKSAYPLTGSQQTINGVIHKPTTVLPNKVSLWQWPVKGKLIGTFSANEQGNKGIKIAGVRGQLIKAAAAGRVVYAGNALRGYGNLVIIKHSDNYLSAYAHTEKILVKEKQFVKAGQNVAKMGSTGTDRVMLHFEIRYLGKSVNPLKYLPKS
ncbi:peptidoglycan DD-metalloendopeptidase family protein [Shewanella surugensis]|uniref:Peptidoglycan DD-metalloendopeptidase family protein n=1 Tax=Shewanella surugensis TaxID=212020 RepID=A0ABT0L8F7_9GAMM|nr:peptidoglycan DD-metalloendopeptidase family protein [Shewanella surugensis]MCL1123989.1 peptidoglycan DD-metalloendopeptidase family protein [Shewanella surugensis]